jgi:hypothetical protein
MNDKYDPFDFKLNGWSEHMSIEVDSYDDIFEELYEKYKGTGAGLPVEAKLLFLIVASGASFHFSKTQLGNLPSSVLGKMMSSNKEQSQFKTPQEVNLENQKKIIKEKEMEIKRKQQQLKTEPMKMREPDTQSQQQPQIFTGASRDIPEIRAPENVKEILNRIKEIQQKNNINTTETQDESTVNDRLVSDSTISNSAKRRGRKAAPKKSILSIAT